jgi:hypothetical protein
MARPALGKDRSMTAPTPCRLVPATATGERTGLVKRIADRIESLTEFDGDMVAPMSRAGFRARIVEAIGQTIEAIDPLPSSPQAGRVSREDVERVARVLSVELGGVWDDLPDLATYRQRKSKPDDGRPIDKAEMRVLASIAITALGLEIEPAQEAGDA